MPRQKNGQLKIKEKKGYRVIGVDFADVDIGDEHHTRFMKFGEDGKLYDYLPPEIIEDRKLLKKGEK